MNQPCKSCGAPLLWAMTPKGKRIPLDPDPVDGGNVELLERHALPPLAVVHAAGAQTLDGSPRHVSHFVTCPQAARHRTRPKGNA